jgi:hypothetical protein
MHYSLGRDTKIPKAGEILTDPMERFMAVKTKVRHSLQYIPSHYVRQDSF